MLVLGDIVGYGADPERRHRTRPALKPVAIVRGNHDKVALRHRAADGFNAVARAAAEWTYEALSRATATWLARTCRRGRSSSTICVEICHGSPVDEDLYIFDETDALRALKSHDPAAVPVRPHALPDHVPAARAANWQAIGPSASPEVTLELKEDVLYLVNPGAVGQPRDGDARAAYAIVDVERKRVEMLRLDYRDRSRRRPRSVDAGLPVVLAKRLAVGR